MEGTGYEGENIMFLATSDPKYEDYIFVNGATYSSFRPYVDKQISSLESLNIIEIDLVRVE